MADTERILYWNDWSGGYHVGRRSVQQAPNTYRGTNVALDPNEGYLLSLPPWRQVVYDSGSPTDPNVQGHVGVFTDGETAWKIHQVSSGSNLNLVKYADIGIPDRVAVTNWPVADVDYLCDTEAWNNQYLFASYLPVANPYNLARFDMNANAWNTYTTPEPLRMIRRWGEFLVGASLTTPYRLWYSAPYDGTTWDVLGYLDIGDAGSISAIVPHGDALYVGKPDGWWTVTGVFGTSTAVRQAATGYPGPNGTVTTLGPRFGWLSNAEAAPFGVLFTSTQLPVTASVMNGTLVEVVNHASPDLTSQDPNETGTWLVYPISPGLFALTSRGFARVNDEGQTIMWMLDARTDDPRWYKVAIPYINGYYTQGIAGKYLPDTVNGGIVWLSVGTDMYQMRLPPLLDTLDHPGERATVYFAEQRRPHPFTVEAMYVEVCWYASADAAPTLSGGVEMRGWTDINQPGRVMSDDINAQLALSIASPPSALYHDDRYVYATFRFTPDAPAGTGVVPIVRFDDCKIRRVWMTVREFTGRS